MNAWLDADRIAGLKQGLLLGVAVLVLVLPPARTPWQPPHASMPSAPSVPAAALRPQLDFAGASSSAEVRRVAQWVLDSGDNGVAPFVILDKKNAQVYVFEPGGTLRGASPVLLGYAPGDDSVAGIGRRPIADVRPDERTTPAGRFVARPGRNTVPEDVLWVDYEAAVSMHRVRLTDPKERREERLATATASDNRISYGCINMPSDFFDTVLWPYLGANGGMVYVLPEIKPLSSVFPGLAPRSPA